MNQEEVKVDDIDYAEMSYLRSAVKEPETVYNLYINNFPFKRLPENLRHLDKVKHFRINGSRKVDWGHAETLINQLETLRLLGFISNNFEKAPFTADSLPHLETLQLDGISVTGLESVLSEAVKLEKLERLSIYATPYQKLPETVLELKNLKSIEIGDDDNLDYEQHIDLLSKIPTLKSLTIAGATVNEFPDSFEKLNLEALTLYRCKALDYTRVLGQALAFNDLKTLEISHTNLAELPEEIQKYKQLKRLILEWNTALDLQKLSEDLAYLPNLEELSLASSDPNPLDKPSKPRLLPANIGGLRKLKKLTLDKMSYLDLEYAFDLLKELPDFEELSMEYISDYESGSNFFKLPTNIQELKGLKKLNLNACGDETFDNLSALPETITHLKKAECGHETFPPLIFTLSKLESLDFRDNGLVSLPAEISQLQNLEHLDLSKNQLEDIPEEIGQLKKLRFLHLAQNPLSEDEAIQQKLKALLPNTVISFYE